MLQSNRSCKRFFDPRDMELRRIRSALEREYAARLILEPKAASVLRWSDSSRRPAIADLPRPLVNRIGGRLFFCALCPAY